MIVSCSPVADRHPGISRLRLRLQGLASCHFEQFIQLVKFTMAQYQICVSLFVFYWSLYNSNVGPGLEMFILALWQVRQSNVDVLCVCRAFSHMLWTLL